MISDLSVQVAHLVPLDSELRGAIKKLAEQSHKNFQTFTATDTALIRLAQRQSNLVEMENRAWYHQGYLSRDEVARLWQLVNLLER